MFRRMGTLIFLVAVAMTPIALLADQPGQAIEVVLDNKNFVPASKSSDLVNFTWRGCTAADIMSRLKKEKPDSITKVPNFEGKMQLYGYMNLGNKENNCFNFVMDVLPSDQMKMYFDFNQNGNLDDDGPPLKNMGKFKDAGPSYATQLQIPWDSLIVNSPYHEKFKIWFMINPHQYSLAGFSHYCQTQLVGTVTIGGAPVKAVIADRAENDNNADFTDDGINLFLGDKKPRYISDKEARDGVEINGAVYKFHFSYGKGQ
ncbi:MAG: hypothetical protein HQM08_15845 [Candidatus Riflebacteria bacterium]|nr:hypothetical protein [Candidatus Riflebacteria bacterium]